MKLEEILTGYKNTVLDTMAVQRGLRPAGRKPKKQDVIKLLVEHGFTPAAVEQAYTKTTSTEREIIQRLQRLGGETKTPALKQSLLRAGLVAKTPEVKFKSPYYPATAYEGSPHYLENTKLKERDKLKPVFEDAMAHLALLGLVLSYGVSNPLSTVVDWSPGQNLVIPEPVRSALPPPPPDQLALHQAPTNVAESSARLFLRDLGRYWRYARREGSIRLTAQGWVYKATLKNINETLSVQADLGAGKSEEDNGRLLFLRRLLLALGLTRETGDTITVIEDSPFWGQPAAERVRSVLTAWRDGSTWNELVRIPAEQRGYDAHRPAPKELAAARKLVLDQMRQLDTGGWMDFERLLDQIRLANYEFLFPRPKSHYGLYRSAYNGNATTPYYYGNNAYGISFPTVADEATGWQTVEAAVIAHIIAGPLFWMGLVDLGLPTGAGYSETMFPLAYRLTAIGRWLLDLGSEVEIPEEGGRVVVQPNFTILAMEPISDETLITLDQFAQPQGGDRVMNYDLTRESVYRGQQRGWSVARIREYLETASGRELPPNVARSLEEWQAIYERISIRRHAVVVETARPGIMAELRADPDLKPALGPPLTDTLALSLKPVADLTTRLRKRGWIPLMTDNGKPDVHDQVVADANGEVRFVMPLPSFYIRSRLTAWSEQQDGHWRLTRESVQAALRAGKTVDQILNELAGIHQGAVPSKLIQRIKAWGEYYGQAKAERLILIEFRDQAALRELLADPELSPYLSEFPAGNRPLAQVATGQLDRVRELLAERGVPLDEKL